MTDHDNDKVPEEAFDFATMLGPEPQWLTCSCGVKTARVPCWDCSRTNEATARDVEARKVSLASIPKRYEWAKLNVPELYTRVKSRELLGGLVTRILASENVVFSGPSGSGKTSLAIACLRERLPHGLFVSAMKLGTARIQGRAGDGEASLVERAMTAPLVLLDEVGGEVKTATNAVKDVIWDRYDNDLPTWITTGFKHEELLAMYGDGARRRLYERATLVQLGGKT